MKYASPLFILRNECSENLYAVLENLKKIGFDGIEFLGFFNHKPEKIAEKMKELGLEALGNHVPYDEFIKNSANVIASHKILGCKYITISGGIQLPYEETNFHEWVSNVTEIGRACRKEGITLLFHNHHHEILNTVHGEHLLTHILYKVPADALSLEPDLGWMAIAGATPKDYLVRYKDRCPVLHLKDYYTELPLYKAIPGDVTTLGSNRGSAEMGFFEFRPTGYGVMNYPSIQKQILECNPEWTVLDHDLAYDRDPYKDLEISLEYAKMLLGVHHKS